MHTLAAIIVVLCSLIGIALTIVILPGTWLAVLAALCCKLWQPQLMSWWVVGAAAALATLAEVVEFGASAVGTAKAGGTKRGGVGSLVGGLAGAIFGAPFFLGLGAIPGAVVGAGVGALLAERVWAKRSWTDAGKSGKGAAVGRLVATVLKVAFAAAIALLLSIAVIASFFKAANVPPTQITPPTLPAPSTPATLTPPVDQTPAPPAPVGMSGPDENSHILGRGQSLPSQGAPADVCWWCHGVGESPAVRTQGPVAC